MRRNMSLTQLQLAIRADLSRGTIYLIECGARPRPSPETLRRLADVLGVEPRELLEH